MTHSTSSIWTPNSNVTRRELVKRSSQFAIGGAVGTMIGSRAFAMSDDVIQVALIGAGGRGTGAGVNILSTTSGPIKLVAVADVFPDRLQRSLEHLSSEFPDKVDVPEDRRFIGFDAYKQAMDALRPGDLVMLTTPPAFRWVHFQYAIEKGLNVFMEKPVAVDGPTVRRMLALGEEAARKNLKVGVGLMNRHCEARKELLTHIDAGEIGDLLMFRAYRMTGPTAWAFTGPKPEGMSELMYQVQRFHAFLWASGGAFSDFLIHSLDECCWIKGAWPVKARASGGRHYRGDNVDQNFDTYNVEYTFADGTKLFLEGRNRPGSYQEFATYAHGSKGAAVIAANGHAPAHCRIVSGHDFDPRNNTWAYQGEEPDTYQTELDHLVEAIRSNTPYNEVQYGAEASLACVMGRMSAHTGQEITWDQALNHMHEMAPGIDQLTMDSAAPVLADSNGKYPVPRPGIVNTREY